MLWDLLEESPIVLSEMVGRFEFVILNYTKYDPPCVRWSFEVT